MPPHVDDKGHSFMKKPAKTTFPIHNLMEQRWSPRAFSNQVVSLDQVKVLLEAARWAPSCFNEQPWRYVVCHKKNPAGFKTLLECLMSRNQTWASHAQLLVLAAAKNAYEDNGRPNAHAWHDVGMANAQLVLQAQAIGLSVHAMAGFDSEKTREALAIPSGFSPVSVLAIGFVGQADQLPTGLQERELEPRIRHPQKAFAFENKWGIPF